MRSASPEEVSRCLTCLELAKAPSSWSRQDISCQNRVRGFSLVRIAFAGCVGSGVDRQLKRLSHHHALPTLPLKSALKTALARRLLHFLRKRELRELAKAQEGAQLDEDGLPVDEDSSLERLISLTRLPSDPSIAGDPPEDYVQQWEGLDEAARSTVFSEAIRKVLHPEMGAALLDGGWRKGP